LGLVEPQLDRHLEGEVLGRVEEGEERHSALAFQSSQLPASR
jgi:hypothetical protein